MATLTKHTDTFHQAPSPSINPMDPEAAAFAILYHGHPDIITVADLRIYFTNDAFAQEFKKTKLFDVTEDESRMHWLTAIRQSVMSKIDDSTWVEFWEASACVFPEDEVKTKHLSINHLWDAYTLKDTKFRPIFLNGWWSDPSETARAEAQDNEMSDIFRATLKPGDLTILMNGLISSTISSDMPYIIRYVGQERRFESPTMFEVEIVLHPTVEEVKAARANFKRLHEAFVAASDAD